MHEFNNKVVTVEDIDELINTIVGWCTALFAVLMVLIYEWDQMTVDSALCILTVAFYSSLSLFFLRLCLSAYTIRVLFLAKYYSKPEIVKSLRVLSRKGMFASFTLFFFVTTVVIRYTSGLNG